MPRRVNRHLFTPPLPQRAGIDPVSLTLPAHPALHETTQGPDAHPSTVAQYLISRFSPEEPATILDCFTRHEVRTDDGTILTNQTPYLPGLRIWYYRPLPEEPPLPDDLPVLYEDEHLLAVDKPHYLPVTPRAPMSHRLRSPNCGYARIILCSRPFTGWTAPPRGSYSSPKLETHAAPSR